MKYFIKSKLSDNISVTPEGYLLCKNVLLTHTGELEYIEGEHPFEEIKGSITVTRDIEELSSDETIASFTGKSITVEHPEDWVTPDNWQETTHGIIMNVRPSPEKIEVNGEMVDGLLGDFLITTSQAIKEVQDGLREVSLGYDALWVQTGDKTAKHTKIRGNHCAIVEYGRAGIECAIKDSKGDIMTLKEQFKSLFGVSLDSAIKKKAKEKAAADKKAKDAEEAKKKAEEEQKAKDEAEAAAKAKKDAEGKKTTDEGVEERLAKLEEMLVAIIAKLSGDDENAEEETAEEIEESDEEVVDEDEETEDEDSEEEGSEEELEVSDEELEVSDEDSEEDEDDNKSKKKVSDTMARAEILAPGIRESKNVRREALQKAFGTKDGKAIIQPLLGKKKIAELKESVLQSVFYAASELMKESRLNNHAKVKSLTIDSFPSLKQKGMSAEQINEANKKRYNR